jgi:hypothetical protein
MEQEGKAGSTTLASQTPTKGVSPIVLARVTIGRSPRTYVTLGYKEWRQWRKPRTKVQNLLKRGVSAASSCAALPPESDLHGRRECHFDARSIIGHSVVSGAACRVVWGLEVRHLRLPDYVVFIEPIAQ